MIPRGAPALGLLVLLLAGGCRSTAGGSGSLPAAPEAPSAAPDAPPAAPPTPPGAGSGPTGQDAPPSKWAPPVPAADDFDWIQLKSGEWLKGEIKSLQEDQLEFDSDELDDLTFDWEDVIELRTPRFSTIRLEDGQIYQGTVSVQDGEVVVADGTSTHRFRRDSLLTMIPGRPRERNYWSGKVSLGLQIRTGNVDQNDLNGLVVLSRRTIVSRWDTSYNGTLSSVQGVQTTNTHRLQTGLDVFLSRRFYVTPLSVDAFRDPFQNTDLRLTPGAGVGYAVIDRGGLEWDVTTVAGLRYTEYVSVPPGSPSTEHTAALLAGTDLDWDLTKRVELDFTYSVQIALAASGSTNQHAALLLSFEFFKDLDLDISAIWDYVGDPVTEEDGTVPNKNDLRLSFGLGWEF